MGSLRRTRQCRIGENEGGVRVNNKHLVIRKLNALVSKTCIPQIFIQTISGDVSPCIRCLQRELDFFSRVKMSKRMYNVRSKRGRFGIFSTPRAICLSSLEINCAVREIKVPTCTYVICTYYPITLQLYQNSWDT